jgi:arylsulfatase A-like enzyme
VKRYIPLPLFLTLFAGCAEEETINNNTPAEPPNILLIIADDMGKDATSGFSEGTTKPGTPHLDELKNSGITFNNMWVSPACSPTRACIITGKYGYRTGVKWANDELSNTEITLQKYISQETDNTYATAVIGKWHLSGEVPSNDPESFGIGYFSGLTRGAVQNYYQWQLTEDGSGALETDYVTTVFTDLSIEWISNQTKPWFLWLAYTAPHTPFHIPPAEMHSQGNLPEYELGMDATPYYMAAIEAMDFQIGRLLDSLPDDVRENTLIIFLGDNGTPGQVAQSPYSRDKVKGSLYQGGINIPMFIYGKGVERTGTDDNLICATDLFSTIAEIAGVETTQINDSKSFKALLTENSHHRDFQYSDMNDGTDDAWAISNGDYKLIVNSNGNQEMYDLANDPYELTDLLIDTLTAEQSAAKSALETELGAIRN